MSASLEACGRAIQKRTASATHLPALTGMRAVAALLVVATHAAFATGALNRGYLGAVYARLDIGVAIFFALSGFLLFRPWVTAATTGAAPPSPTLYARHRVRRIVPAYLVAVLATFAVYTVFTPGPNPGQTWHGLLRYLTLTQIYTDDYLFTYLHTGLSQMWSLAVEVSFYAALPAIATVLLRRATRSADTLKKLAALSAVTPLWLIVAHTTDLLPNSAGMWLPGHLACFTGGMAVAVLAVHGARWNAWATLPVATALFLAVATPIGGVIVGPDPAWVPVTKAVLYAAISTLVVGTAVLGSRGVYTRVLSSRPLTWLGEISYEIFLLHVAVMAVLMHVVLRWPLFTGSLAVLYTLTLAVTILLAYLLHHYTRVRSAGTNSASARPRCDAASFSSGVNSAAVRVEPSPMNTGS